MARQDSKPEPKQANVQKAKQAFAYNDDSGDDWDKPEKNQNLK